MGSMIYWSVVTIILGLLLNLFMGQFRNLPEPDEGPDVKLLILGKAGSGRSALGNTLLGMVYFKSYFSPSPITKKNQIGETKIGSRHLFIVDTPGIDADTSEDEAKDTIENLKSALNIFSNGYNGFLIVMNPVVRISQEDINIIRFLQITLGDDFFEFVIFVFTHKDILETIGITGQNATDDFLFHIEKQQVEMKNILEKAGRRLLFVNNQERDVYRNRVFHVTLIRMIDRIWKRQNNRSYTRENLDKAQEKLTQEIIRKVEAEERESSEREQRIRDDALRDCAVLKKDHQPINKYNLVENLHLHFDPLAIVGDALLKMGSYVLEKIRSGLGLINKNSRLLT